MKPGPRARQLQPPQMGYSVDGDAAAARAVGWRGIDSEAGCTDESSDAEDSAAWFGGAQAAADDLLPDLAHHRSSTSGLMVQQGGMGTNCLPGGPAPIAAAAAAVLSTVACYAAAPLAPAAGGAAEPLPVPPQTPHAPDSVQQRRCSWQLPSGLPATPQRMLPAAAFLPSGAVTGEMDAGPPLAASLLGGP